MIHLDFFEKKLFANPICIVIEEQYITHKSDGLRRLSRNWGFCKKQRFFFPKLASN
jgi:hypothetical protein